MTATTPPLTPPASKELGFRKLFHLTITTAGNIPGVNQPILAGLGEPYVSRIIAECSAIQDRAPLLWPVELASRQKSRYARFFAEMEEKHLNEVEKARREVEAQQKAEKRCCCAEAREVEKEEARTTEPFPEHDEGAAWAVARLESPSPVSDDLRDAALKAFVEVFEALALSERGGAAEWR